MSEILTMSTKSKPYSFLELLLNLPWILREPHGQQKPVILPKELGLGDSIHNRFERWGIGPKVRAYAARHKRNCGCESRRQQLNRWWPYPPEPGKVFLTIGMPHFQDWEGAWATIQSVLWEALAAGISHQIEILVVDQSPTSEHGKKLKGYLAGWVPRSKYVEQENVGTALGKSAVFQQASGEWVLLLDCHAALKPGSLRRMFDFMVQHRHDGNLYSGVMDLGAAYQEHRETISQLGEWIDLQKFNVVGSEFRVKVLATLPPQFRHLPETAINYVASKMQTFRPSEHGVRKSELRNHILGTDHGYHTHVDRVWRGDSLGRWATDPRAADENAAPFEIDNAAGWFLFCRRDAWLMVQPYHPLMRGFGGEEGVMVAAFNGRGRKCLLAPFARGTHRFGRADGVKFSLTLADRLRNYALAFHSLNRRDELDRMRQYFVTDRGKKEVEGTAEDFKNFRPMAEAEFDAIVAGAIADHEAWFADAKAKRNPPPKPLSELYRKAKTEPSDFNEHVERLKQLATECSSVVEFGTRHGVSTVAILAAQPKRFWTVDKQCQTCNIGHIQAVKGETDFQLVQSDSLTYDIKEPVDLVFIDTLHTADQIFQELTKHAPQCKKYIALHDTEYPWGQFDEGGGSGGGIRAGLDRWFDTDEGRHWSILEDHKNNHGFAILSRKLPPDAPL